MTTPDDLIERLEEVGASQQHIDSDFARAKNAAGTVREAVAEIDRLNAALRYEQHLAGRIGTHSDG